MICCSILAFRPPAQYLSCNLTGYCGLATICFRRRGRRPGPLNRKWLSSNRGFRRLRVPAGRTTRGCYLFRDCAAAAGCASQVLDSARQFRISPYFISPGSIRITISTSIGTVFKSNWDAISGSPHFGAVGSRLRITATLQNAGPTVERAVKARAAIWLAVRGESLDSLVKFLA